MLGGRVAEQIFIKDISTGAQNDIERATKIARKMVTEWGMSSKLGPMNYSSTSEVFLGRDYQTQVSYSDKTASQIDDEIKQILNSCYDRAKEILTNHAQQMNTMTEVLLEKETIYFNEVELIMKGKTTKQILRAMEKEETRNKARIEIERAEADLERIKKDQAIRIKTAEALKNGGVITQEEIEKVKIDAEKLIKQAEQKVEELKQKSETKKNLKTKTSKDTEELKQQSNNEVVAKDLDVNAKNVLVKEKEAKIDVKTTKEKENNKK